MNFLSIFVLIPLLMLAGLWAARGIKAIRGVMVTGASALLIASVVLTFLYLGERSAGNTAEMLFRADTLWYAPLHISYSVGVDGNFGSHVVIVRLSLCSPVHSLPGVCNR